MNDNGQALAFIWMFLVVAVTVLSPGRKLVQLIVQLRRLSGSAVRPVAGLGVGARALVLGTATGERALAPVSGTPCLFWHLRVRTRRRRASWKRRAQAPLLLDDGTGTVEVDLRRADLSFLGTEMGQITTFVKRPTDGATSVVTDVRTIPPSAPAAQAGRSQSRLRQEGFGESSPPQKPFVGGVWRLGLQKLPNMESGAQPQDVGIAQAAQATH